VISNSSAPAFGCPCTIFNVDNSLGEITLVVTLAFVALNSAGRSKEEGEHDKAEKDNFVVEAARNVRHLDKVIFYFFLVQSILI